MIPMIYKHPYKKKINPLICGLTSSLTDLADITLVNPYNPHSISQSKFILSK